MKRSEAIELLREISDVCGDAIGFDSVSISPVTTKMHSGLAEICFRVFLGTDENLSEDERITSILLKHGFKLTVENGLIVIEDWDRQTVEA